MGLIGGPVKIHDAVFVDAPLADFFVTERHGAVHAIRWLESGDFAAGLTRTLSAYVRLHDAGRDELARALGLAPDFPRATLILVSDRMDDDWVRVVSTLNLPVMLLRAHSLVDGTRHSAGCLFEKCFASRPPRERPGAGAFDRIGPAVMAPRVEDEASGISAAGTASTEKAEPFPDEEAPPEAESGAARHLQDIAGDFEEIALEGSVEPLGEDELPCDDADAEPMTTPAAEPLLNEEPIAAEPREFPEPVSEGAPFREPAEAENDSAPVDDDPSRLLSDEELATFRLLENVLEATRAG